jgi:hypothetical protein
MTAVEKAQGYISRAQDSDPYLVGVRQSVAREAETYAASYPEGTGPGLRYTAFDRYSKMAVQSVSRLQHAQQALSEFRSSLKPLDSTENQLRRLPSGLRCGPMGRRPGHPAFPEIRGAGSSSVFRLRRSLVRRTGGPAPCVQRALHRTHESARVCLRPRRLHRHHRLLLAYAAGPFFYGAPEDRWFAAGAALDSADEQVFLRDLVRKLVPGPQGLAQMEESALSPGELQLFLLLMAKGLAARSEEKDKIYYLLDQSLHQRMVESLAVRGLSLHATAQPARG